MYIYNSNKKQKRLNIKIMTLTLPQKKALYLSIRDQQSLMTLAERELLNVLEIEFRNSMDVMFAEEVNGMYILNGKAKQINMDIFGDTYRNRWSKIKTDKDGDEYIRTSYSGKWYLTEHKKNRI